MKVFEQPQIVAAMNEDRILAAIREAFVSFAAGKAEIAPVGHLNFVDPPGDCHIKSARVGDDPLFTVKVSSSFYYNPRRGLSSSQGAMLVVSAETGEMLGLLNDGGYLTDQRTVLASVLAAQAIARPGMRSLGIVGTGVQARLHAEILPRRLGFEDLLIWGRDSAKAAGLAETTDGRTVGLEELSRTADLIITSTPSTGPLIRDEWIFPGARIIAMGADSPGKRELDPEILGRARVIVDSRSQCLAHGETYWAVEAGLVDIDSSIELGEVLAESTSFADDDIVVADMTGVAIQDAAIASDVWAALTA